MLVSSVLSILALSTLAVAQTGNANCDACVNAGQAIATCEQQSGTDTATPFACICNANTVLPLLQSCFQCSGAVEALTPAAVQSYIDECKTLSTATIATGTDLFPLPTDSSAGATTSGATSGSASVTASSASVATAATTAASTSGSASSAAATTAAAKSAAGTNQARAGISLFIVSVLAVVIF